MKINIVIHPEINEGFIQNFSISKRETEIIKDLIKRKKTRQIGEHFFISPKTVENHIASIYRKAGVANREELIEKIKDSE
jgi:DNA-binding CsgD family transcriptional regulator